MNVHAKSCLIPEPLRTLRSEAKGKAGACPDRTRAIPCTVRVVTMVTGRTRAPRYQDARARKDQRLRATLGATRINDLLALRTRPDNGERRARGHELI